MEPMLKSLQQSGTGHRFSVSCWACTKMSVPGRPSARPVG